MCFDGGVWQLCVTRNFLNLLAVAVVVVCDRRKRKRDKKEKKQRQIFEFSPKEERLFWGDLASALRPKSNFIPIAFCSNTFQF